MVPGDEIILGSQKADQLARDDSICEQGGGNYRTPFLFSAFLKIIVRIFRKQSVSMDDLCNTAEFADI